MPKVHKQSEEVVNLKSQLVRALADYDNFRKRTEARELDLRLVLTAKIVSSFLPILDMLYEAQKHLNDSGITFTIKEFEDTLGGEGIEKIEPKKGEEFTEDLHEAIDTASKEGLKEGQIINCILVGWKFKEGNVIRHAKVAVNKSS